MVVSRRKEKWDGFVNRLEELRAEVQEEEEKPKLPSGKKTSSE